ncbi:MAG TPA: hypothetical protein PK417_06590 [Hyphomonas sp.]|nr:hypothetical protein [Hyphomonas sp.]
MRLACLTALPLLAYPALAETPLEAALAAPTEGPSYRFEMKIDDGKLKAAARVDPSLPEGERMTLITPAADTLSEEAAERFAKLKESTSGENIWCSGFNGNIPKDAQLVSESGEAAVYSFTPLPGEDKENGKLFKHLTGKVTVSKEKPSILAFEMSSKKPFKPGMAARVDSFSMKVNCDYAPDGRTYIRDFAFDLAGNAMMQPFNQSERREITRLVALPSEIAAGQR